MRRIIAIAFVLASGCVVGEDAPDGNGAATDDTAPDAPDDSSGAGLDLDVLAASTGNLLADPGFEWPLDAASNWKSGWSGDGGSVQRMEAARYTGSYGLRIRSGAGTGPVASAWQRVDAVPGRSYTVTAITRRRTGDAGDQQWMSIQFGRSDASGEILLSEHRVATGYSTSWHKLSKVATAPDGANELYVWIGDLRIGEDYGSTHDWDAFRLVAN